MEIGKFIIEHRGLEWPKLLVDWSWLLPKDISVLFMNRFGDLFILLDDGSVSMLDVGSGTIERVAASRDDFTLKIKSENLANYWFMIPLLNKVEDAGITLCEGQCYGYLQSPVFGGDYSVENTVVLPITEHLSVNADIHRQIQYLPDDTEIKLVVTD